MEKIKDLLANHPFFKDLKKDQLEFLAGCGKNVQFKKGEQIFKEGEAADYFYVIRKGKVALDIDGAQRGLIRIQTIEEGEILGWSWLIPPHKWAFSVTAVETTSVTAMDGKCLRGKCEKDHELGYELLKRFSAVLAKRLQWTRMQLLDVYGS
jgi:signal-transduction protein with cAMP-binding, CBS, and nucleotidyltransferase domain